MLPAVGNNHALHSIQIHTQALFISELVTLTAAQPWWLPTAGIQTLTQGHLISRLATSTRVFATQSLWLTMLRQCQ
eukprot:1137043-Pelagomonas_calceolata.AAC.6